MERQKSGAFAAGLGRTNRQTTILNVQLAVINALTVTNDIGAKSFGIGANIQLLYVFTHDCLYSRSTTTCGCHIPRFGR